MNDYKRGDRVEARNAYDEWVKMRALSGEEQGADFRIVWLCTETRWRSEHPDKYGGIPWPVEDVRRPTAEGVTDGGTTK